MQKKDNIIEDKNTTLVEKRGVISGDEFKLVVGIVRRGFATEVISAARENGGDGAVILQGTGVSKNTKRFLGMAVDPEREVIMMVVKEEVCYPVIKAMYAAVDFKSPGKGMFFALPVACVTGLSRPVGKDE